MIRKIRQSMRSQKGFTLVELMVVVAILGILAAIAIPRLTNSTALANTSRTAADLRTIDSAITLYLANESTALSTSGKELVDKGYLAAWPKTPTGQAYIGKDSPEPLPTGSYAIVLATDKVPARAVLGTYHAEDFYKGPATPATPPAE